MSGLFKKPKAPEQPDPNALPEAKLQSESLLTPGADADLDPQALLARDQATANALAQGARTSPVTLRAPYLERAREDVKRRERETAEAAETERRRRAQDEDLRRERDRIAAEASA